MKKGELNSQQPHGQSRGLEGAIPIAVLTTLSLETEATLQANRKVKDGVNYKKLTLIERETNYLIERRMRCSSPCLKVGGSAV